LNFSWNTTLNEGFVICGGVGGAQRPTKRGKGGNATSRGEVKTGGKNEKGCQKKKAEEWLIQIAKVKIKKGTKDLEKCRRYLIKGLVFKDGNGARGLWGGGFRKTENEKEQAILSTVQKGGVGGKAKGNLKWGKKIGTEMGTSPRVGAEREESQ